MLVLPWYIRFGFDCMLVVAPLYYFHSTLCKYGRSPDNPPFRDIRFQKATSAKKT